MGRLIDAENAKLMLSELLEVAEKENFTAEDAISHAFEWIDNLPTAYDVEAKVVELEKHRHIDRSCGDVEYSVYLDEAISIVRGKE